MSADNTIVVLHLKDQYRVAHVQAVENLWDSWNPLQKNGEILSSRAFGYFNGAKSFKEKTDALNYASKIYDDFEYVEYGIKVFHLNKSWEQVVREARIMIADEKEYVKAYPIAHKDFILDELNHIYSKILKFHVNATMLPSIEP